MQVRHTPEYRNLGSARRGDPMLPISDCVCRKAANGAGTEGGMGVITRRAAPRPRKRAHRRQHTACCPRCKGSCGDEVAGESRKGVSGGDESHSSAWACNDVACAVAPNWPTNTSTEDVGRWALNP